MLWKIIVVVFLTTIIVRINIRLFKFSIFSHVSFISSFTSFFITTCRATVKMFDWFDEPIVYYRRFVPMRSGVFDYMSRWMDSVDRAMEEEFGDFYDRFFSEPRNPAIEHKKDEDKKEEEKKEEPKKEEKKQEESSKPKEEEKKKVEEPEDNDEDEEPQYYSFSSSMYSGSDGVQHIFREEHDSKTGRHKVVETRRIGDKSMTLHRVTDKDGNVEEHETRKNIKDDEELEAFKKDWIARNVPESHKLAAPKREDTKAIKHDN